MRLLRRPHILIFGGINMEVVKRQYGETEIIIQFSEEDMPETENSIVDLLTEIFSERVKKQGCFSPLLV